MSKEHEPKKEGELIYIPSDQVAGGLYGLFRAIDVLENGTIVENEESTFLFQGEDGLGSNFLAMAIIQVELKKGNNVFLIYSDQDNPPKFPYNYQKTDSE